MDYRHDLEIHNFRSLSRLNAYCNEGLFAIICALLINAAVSNVASAQWEDLSNFSDAKSEIAEPSNQALPLVPSDRATLKAEEFFRALNDPELSNDIDQSFAAIQELKGQGNAFNLELGEQYLTHGFLLREAGEIDEAISMLVNALHIQKANYGLYDARHISILENLFEFNFDRSEPQLAEGHLTALMLLEEQLGEEPVGVTYDMMIRMGHHYLDAYYKQPRNSDDAVLQLRRAAKYFKETMLRYADSKLSERLLPYGEYTYTQSLLTAEYESRVTMPLSNLSTSASSVSAFSNPASQEIRALATRSKVKAENAIESFLRDAQAQNNQSMVARAYLSMADLMQLTDRERSARTLYKQAWAIAKDLESNDPQRLIFDKVRKLPNFLFSQQWERTPNSEKTRITVPVKLSLNRFGRVTDIEQVDPKGVMNNALFSRAVRAIRNITYAPPMRDGEFVSLEKVDYKASFLISNSWLERQQKREERALQKAAESTAERES